MADDEGPDQQGDDEEVDEDTEDDEASLRDPGKRALERLRAKNRAQAAEIRDLKPKAARARELEDADKSVSQKQADRILELEREGAEKDQRASERIAKSDIAAALASVVADRKLVREIVDDLNLSNYVGDDGEVDEKRVEKLLDRYADMGKPPTGGRMPTGARGTSPSADMNALIRQAAGRA